MHLIMKYCSIPLTPEPSPIYLIRACTEAPSDYHEQARAYLLRSNATTFPSMAHLPIESSFSPASGLDRHQVFSLKEESSYVDREDSDLSASHIQRRRKFACIWSSITLLLSAGSGIGSGLASRSLDVGLGIGTTVLTVLAAVQSIVAVSRAMSNRKNLWSESSYSNSRF